jgi:hypothetical protein
MNAALGVRFAFSGVSAMPFICPSAGENAILKFCRVQEGCRKLPIRCRHLGLRAEVIGGLNLGLGGGTLAVMKIHDYIKKHSLELWKKYPDFKPDRMGLGGMATSTINASLILYTAALFVA